MAQLQAIYNDQTSFETGTLINASASTGSVVLGNQNYLSFNGTSDNVSFPYQMVDMSGDFTVEILAAFGTSGSDRSFLTQFDTAYSTDSLPKGFSIAQLTANTIRFGYRLTNGGSWVGLLETTTTYTTGDIVHVIVSRTGTTVSLTVNGTEEDSATDSNDFTAGLTVDTVFGRAWFGDVGWGTYNDCDLYFLRVWDEAKTAGEIGLLTNSFVVGDEPNLLSSYQLFTTGATLVDDTATYNGTVTGGTWNTANFLAQWTSPDIDLTSLSNLVGIPSILTWTDTPNGETILAATSLSTDEGTTWTDWAAVASSGDDIPGITPAMDLSTGLLRVRFGLKTESASIPQVDTVTATLTTNLFGTSTESITMSDDFGLPAAITEAITLDAYFGLLETILEACTAADALDLTGSTWNATSTDSTTATDAVVNIRQQVFAVTEALTMSGAITALEAAIVLEALGISSAASAAGSTFNRTITQALTLSAQVLLAFSLSLAETVTATDTTASNFQRAVVIAESLLLASAVPNQATAVAVAITAVTLTDTLTSGKGATAVDSLTLQENLAQNMTAYPVLAEALLFSETPAFTLNLYGEVEDDVTVDAAQAINQSLQAAISDGIAFALSFGFDDATYAGWVMNTRNFAVSEYTNYPFNSFAKIGGNYYGANSSGLYLLDGDDDDGTAIQAQVTLGKIAFGEKLTRIRSAYLGVRSSGSLVLKVVDDTDSEYWYEMNESDWTLRDRRVKLGRGLKSRYWQFKLENVEGADFELDEIVLYPVVLSRR